MATTRMSWPTRSAKATAETASAAGWMRRSWRCFWASFTWSRRRTGTFWAEVYPLTTSPAPSIRFGIHLSPLKNNMPPFWGRKLRWENVACRSPSPISSWECEKASLRKSVATSNFASGNPDPERRKRLCKWHREHREGPTSSCASGNPWKRRLQRTNDRISNFESGKTNRADTATSSSEFDVLLMNKWVWGNLFFPENDFYNKCHHQRVSVFKALHWKTSAVKVLL